MVIVFKKNATQKEIHAVEDKIIALGYTPHEIIGVERKIIGAVGDERFKEQLQVLETFPGVESTIAILKPYKLASREFKPNDTVVQIDGSAIGGKKITLIAGPCSVESREQICSTAAMVKEAGAGFLRGGAFKPRTSPYSFQGLEEEGLKLLAEAKEKTGLPVVTEVMNPREVELITQYADVLQVGARNVQNFSLLKELGNTNMPILLKRGMMITIKEYLMSAEYILAAGNNKIILCERGIRTIETMTRNTLDINCIPVLKKESHLPVLVDPSHATGHWDLVESMSLASIVAGADGLMIEVHPDPANALSDGGQSLKPKKFAALVKKLKPFVELVGRTL